MRDALVILGMHATAHANTVNKTSYHGFMYGVPEFVRRKKEKKERKLNKDIRT